MRFNSDLLWNPRVRVGCNRCFSEFNLERKKGPRQQATIPQSSLQSGIKSMQSSPDLLVTGFLGSPPDPENGHLNGSANNAFLKTTQRAQYG